MKKEITIYYKDSAQDEYVTRRVLTQEGNYYKLTSYWKKGKNIERYESRLKLSKSEANKYIIQCNKEYSDTIMKHYEIGAFKSFTLCKECEKQLINVSKVDTVKKVISIDNNIYY